MVACDMANQKTNQKHQPQNQDDPQIPRPDLRFVRKTAMGKSPNTNTHKKRFAKDTAVEHHCVLYKNMQT